VDPDPEVPMTNDELAAVLAKLDIPNEFPSVLAIWPRWADGGIEVHLGATAFWRIVKRLGVAVTSAQPPDLLTPHRHRFTWDGVEFVTTSPEPVLPPGTLTPGYALRLT
jgi:hypothetical protein